MAHNPVRNEVHMSDKYPYVFVGNEPYDFPVGAGWHDLCARTFGQIMSIYKKHKVPLERLSLMQLKEKYGGLRIYVGALPIQVYDEVDTIIRQAEKESLTICEICGQPGHHWESGGWVMTRCDKHASKGLVQD
ncbi:MAG: hypothetical protein PHX74_04665 [Candidatus Sumerlaeales bacterium]|nr:hypothetical protein [Candidatus Sumerlaeales bacterium]